ncbi:MAG: ketopantoate reductase family protein [Candidatus Hodarchaeota archaeon]
MDKKQIKIGFIGAGSIGSLFGGYLAAIQSKNYLPELIFFCREDHAKKINKSGLKIDLKGSVRIVDNIKAFKNLEDYISSQVDNNIGFDFIFLTTKTYDIRKALFQYMDLIEKTKWLVILQNGIGNEDEIKKYYDKNKLVRIVTSHGALLKNPGYVYHTGRGFTYIGFPFKDFTKLSKEEYQDARYLLETILKLAGIESSFVEDIVEKSWEKAFVNIGINALGALTRLKNGRLLESEGLRKIMAGAVKEALRIAELKEIDLSKGDFIELTYSVAKETYNNKNSMLQDVIKGKKTEIDFMNGKIVEYARELGIKVPINEILTNLIKGLEES